MPLRRKLLAALLLVLVAILVACQAGGKETPPTATVSPEAQARQRLEELSTDALLALTFPGVALQRLPATGPEVFYLLEADPSWRIEPLGRLIGYFTVRDRPQLAAFLNLDGPPDAQAPPRSQLLDLPEGVFIAFVELGGNNQPVLTGLGLVDASARELLEAATALEQNRLPFRQGVDNLAPGGSLTPTLAVDSDNDGLEEIVLLDTGTADGICATFYLTFRWAGSGLQWQRIAPAPNGTAAGLSAQAVLDYLAAVGAATTTAEPWQGLERSRVWAWLAGPDDAVPSALLEELVAAGAGESEASRRKLEAIRRLFSEAYDLLSPDRQRIQPWPAFINSFRNTTGVTVTEMMPPSREGEQTAVEVIIIASSREGPDTVQRRFRVTYGLVDTDEGWRLDSIDAREERLPG